MVARCCRQDNLGRPACLSVGRVGQGPYSPAIPANLAPSPRTTQKAGRIDLPAFTVLTTEIKSRLLSWPAVGWRMRSLSSRPGCRNGRPAGSMMASATIQIRASCANPLIGQQRGDNTVTEISATSPQSFEGRHPVGLKRATKTLISVQRSEADDAPRHHARPRRIYRGLTSCTGWSRSRSAVTVV